jgi:ferredoxin
MQGFRYLPSVTTLRLEEELCIGCGLCTTVCPHGVFELSNGKVQLKDRDGCMECGACAHNCPVGALQLTPGVGCASYIIKKWLKGGSDEPGCSPSCC